MLTGLFISSGELKSKSNDTKKNKQKNPNELNKTLL